MANLTIFGLTQLTSAGANMSTDLVPVWDNDVAETKKMTLSDLRNLMSPANWSDSFSSATQATSSWTPNNAAANVNAAIVPKGTGALVAAIPDGTATGGSARGQYAVDLQLSRTSASHIAGGNYSVILGGSGNYTLTNPAEPGTSTYNTIVGGNNNRIYGVNGSHSFIGGGLNNNISGANTSFIGGGESNFITYATRWNVIAGGRSNSINGENEPNYRTIGGGYANSGGSIGFTIAGGQSNACGAGQYPFIGGGLSNTASGNYGVVSGGQTNTASATHSSVGGGQNNTASGVASIITGGLQGTASLYGQQAHASGSFSANGDAQAHELIWRRATIGTGNWELFLDGSGTAAALPGSNSVWHGILDIVAICTETGNGTTVVGDVFAHTYKVAIKKVSGTVSLVGIATPIGGALSNTSMNTNTISITADTSLQSLRIVYTPPTTAGSTTTIRVVATYRATQIQY